MPQPQSEETLSYNEGEIPENSADSEAPEVPPDSPPLVLIYEPDEEPAPTDTPSDSQSSAAISSEHNGKDVKETNSDEPKEKQLNPRPTIAETPVQLTNGASLAIDDVTPAQAPLEEKAPRSSSTNKRNSITTTIRW